MDNSSKNDTPDLKPISQNEAAKIKLTFKANIDKQLKKVITPEMDDDYINALRKYIIVRMFNREKPKLDELKNVSSMDKETILEMATHHARPLFNARQRKTTKNAARVRYQKKGHGLLSTGQRRLYFPLITVNKKSDTEKWVEEYLNGQGYTIRNYKKGYATDEKGKQTYKIGKLLKDKGAIAKSFEQDASRTSDQQYFVLSDHVNDVVHMSTRKGWETCMSHDGEFNEKLAHDIIEGSLIGYLISKNDPYIFNPLARILFKPLHNKNGDTIYHANGCYGLFSENFKQTAKIISQQVSSNKNGLYELPSAIYRDGSVSKKLTFSDDISAEDFLDLLDLNYTKDITGHITLNGDLDLGNLNLHKLPDLSNITINGHFYCTFNKLTSLIGSPKKVTGDFHCGYNNLTSLTHGPLDVNGAYSCEYNKLTNLIDAPKKVGDNFDCSNNQITSLIGAPKEVEGKFNCGTNLITSLKHAPQKVGTDFLCSVNQLTSLIGAPKHISGNFVCFNNQLMSLIGAPKSVKHGFSCEDNNLTSLEHAPQDVGEYFSCNKNKIMSLIGAPQKIGSQFDCSSNPLTSLLGIPKEFSYVSSDFGFYQKYNEIPAQYLKTPVHNNTLKMGL